MPKYYIADRIIEINAPDWSLHDNLRFFLSDKSGTDIFCRVMFKERSLVQLEQACLILNVTGTTVYESAGYMHILNGDEKNIPSYLAASNDCSDFTLLIDPDYNFPNNEEIVQRIRNDLFDEFRKIMIMALAQNNGIMVHSSTILWNDRGIVFSAPSGTGKSTHAHLWKEMYNTRILDGDVTACRIINGSPYVYGLPWCGTSGEFMNHRAPLGSIVFLEQAKENRIVKLNHDEAFMRLTSRSFLQPFNERMMNQFLDIIQIVSASTNCYLLKCLPDKNAVELVKECL